MCWTMSRAGMRVTPLLRLPGPLCQITGIGLTNICLSDFKRWSSECCLHCITRLLPFWCMLLLPLLLLRCVPTSVGRGLGHHNFWLKVVFLTSIAAESPPGSLDALDSTNQSRVRQATKKSGATLHKYVSCLCRTLNSRDEEFFFY